MGESSGSVVQQWGSVTALAFCQGPWCHLTPFFTIRLFLLALLHSDFIPCGFLGGVILVVWFFRKYVGQKELWIFLLPTTDGLKKIFTGANNFK